MTKRVVTLLIACMLLAACAFAEEAGTADAAEWLNGEPLEEYTRAEITELEALSGRIAAFRSDRHPAIDVYRCENTAASLKEFANRQAAAYGKAAREMTDEKGRSCYRYTAYEISGGTRYMTVNTLYSDEAGNVVETVILEEMNTLPLGDSGLTVSLPRAFRAMETEEEYAVSCWADVMYLTEDGAMAVPADRGADGKMPDAEKRSAEGEKMPLPPEAPAIPEGAEEKIGARVTVYRLPLGGQDTLSGRLAERCERFGLDALHIALNGREAVLLTDMSAGENTLREYCLWTADTLWVLRLEAEDGREDRIGIIAETVAPAY